MGEDAVLRDDWTVPLPGRIQGADEVRDEIRSLHERALAAGMASYVDPTSGFSVFTAGFLASRKYCCGSGCRHCPYAS